MLCFYVEKPLTGKLSQNLVWISKDYGEKKSLKYLIGKFIVKIIEPKSNTN